MGRNGLSHVSRNTLQRPCRLGQQRTWGAPPPLRRWRGHGQWLSPAPQPGEFPQSPESSAALQPSLYRLSLAWARKVPLGVDEASTPGAVVVGSGGAKHALSAGRCRRPRAALSGRPGGRGDDTISFLPAPFVLRHKAPSKVAEVILQVGSRLQVRWGDGNHAPGDRPPPARLCRKQASLQVPRSRLLSGALVRGCCLEG